MATLRMVISAFICIVSLLSDSGEIWGEAPESIKPQQIIDASTMQHKVMCGYQGWFRCPEDAAGRRWRHWSRNAKRITPDSLTIDMWPEMSEYAVDQKYPADGFRYPNGKQAQLFSSADLKTVQLHFQWMKQYGIDGAFAQRFLVNVGDPSLDLVLENVRASAAESGRVYAVCYDLSSTPEDQLFDKLVADWKRLVDEKEITQDDRYLHHNGKPVLFVWGFYADRFSPALANRIIDFLKKEGPYQATLIGGTQWYWQRENDPQWAKVFRRFDIISPWNVGNHTKINGEKHASTGYWKADLTEAKSAGMGYLPVIYPGFSWVNLKGKDAARSTMPRLGGRFFWRQFHAASQLEIDMAYVAMFDEVDEATAIFKVTNSPPAQAPLATYEGLPPDWYLRLTGEGSKVIRGESKATLELPLQVPVK